MIPKEIYDKIEALHSECVFLGTYWEDPLQVITLANELWEMVNSQDKTSSADK